MRKLILVSMLLLTGCSGVVGPRQRAALRDPVDDKSLTMDEQARKARDRLPLPDDAATPDTPRTGMDPPGFNRNGR
jgi:hypothetical protein